ncbi:MAG: reverse transcriptase family protein, partial [Candidatus Thiodiazotropha endolucinida]|nr:reverse transcriptase family protein [Candidatus Thiodiazotropha taylori]MCW4262066.1 reverse transcriptase family protein [Candidatus Thiodiazotropha endolucinida]
MFDNVANIYVLPTDYEVDKNIPRVSQDKIINTNGRKLLDFCKSNSLRICNGRLGADSGVGKYTYVGSTGNSVVDYVIVNPYLFDLFSTFEVCEPNILSDHCVIEFSLKGKYLNERDSENKEDSCFDRVHKKYQWKEEFADQYNDNLNSEEESFKLLNEHLVQSTSPKQIDENISTFTKLMGKICDPLFSKHINLPRYDDVPKSKVSNQPWFDDECHEARKKFYFELNNYRKVKSEYNKSQLGLARSNFKSLTRKKRFNFEKEKTAKLIVSKNKNVKEYWKLLKQAANIRSVNPIGADKFSEYFQAINDPNDRFYQADEDILYFNERYVKGELQVMFDELNVPISIEEIKSSIKQLKNGASAGPDLLLNEFLKNGSNVMLNYLFNLFNKIFEIGYFPENWAEGFIIPVFKKGDKNDVSNYRGITLLSTVSKLFTRVLNNRLNDWAEQYNIYIEAQAGFRKCMGTVDNIFILNSLITHCLNHNERLYCAFIDFTKAFDFVVRDILWFKLLKIGVRGKILDIIKSMYKIVKSRVKHNNLLSQAFTCNLGVRQGECLSPFLFSMYLNDLQEELVSKGVSGIDVGRLNLYLLLYADDIVLFGKTPEDLQNALKILEDYCSRWKLTVNTKKTKIMVFRKGGRL